MVKGVGAGADLWGQILALLLASSFLLSVLSAPFSSWTSLTNHRFKDKIIESFEMAIAKH